MKRSYRIALIIFGCLLGLFVLMAGLGKMVSESNPYFFYGDYTCTSDIKSNEYHMHMSTEYVKIKHMKMNNIKQDKEIYTYKADNGMFLVFNSKSNEFTFLASNRKFVLDEGFCKE